MEKENKTNKKTICTLIGISLAAVLLMGLTYAWLTTTLNGTKVNKITVGALNLTLDDNTSNGINILNGLPQTDEQGLNGNAYTFSVENNGASNAKYNIYLEDEELDSGQTRMSDSNIKYYLVKNYDESEAKLLSTTIEDNKRVIDKDVIINAGDTNNYSLKLWIDSESTQEEVGGKVFKAKIKLEAIQTEESNGPILFNDSTSWSKIITAIKDGKTENFNVGDEKTVYMGETFGKHTLRIANMSKPSTCNNSNFSQTACGFVIEFVDIISKHGMNTTNTNVGGWSASEMRIYVNNDIYNALPSVLKNNIVDTKVISSHGSTSGETNFISTDKLYLLDHKEVTGNNNSTNASLTRQLDYYIGKGSTAYKKDSSDTPWWTRTAYSASTEHYLYIHSYYTYNGHGASAKNAVSPAFRIE